MFILPYTYIKRLKLRYILAMLTVILFTFRLNAQFVKVQDTAFLGYLQDSLPQVLSPELDMLDTTAAATYTETLLIINRPTITNIDEIKYFKQITELMLKEISIIAIPLDENLEGLRRLTFPGVKVEGVLDLTLLTNFSTLNCGGSNVTKVFWPENTKMQRFLMRNCRLTSVPDFTIHPNMEFVNVMYNFLTWEDILAIPYSGESDLVYEIFPQNNLTIDTAINIHENETLTITYPHDSNIDGLKYTWYKDGVELTGIPNSPTLEIPKISADQSGNYYVKTSLLDTETVFGENTLRSGDWNVQVTPCQQISSIKYDLTAGCSDHIFTLHEIEFSSDDKINSLSFIDINTANENKVVLNEPIVADKGVYKLQASDMYGCVIKSEDIDISVNNALVTTLDYKNCNLKVAPDFSIYSKLAFADISNNILSWEDILSIPSEDINAELLIFPQNNLTNDKLIEIHEKETLSIIYPFDTNVEGLKYTWYKAGVEITGIPNSATLEIADISEIDAGNYHLEMSLLDTETPFGTNFVRSGIWTVQVTPCQHISDFAYNLSVSCSEQTISVTEINLTNNEAIETLSLIKESTAEIYEINQNNTLSLDQGVYKLSIEDIYGCLMESEAFDISENNDLLKELDYNNCDLKNIPDLSIYTMLEKADLSNNYLSWDEILNIPDAVLQTDVTIFPQKYLTNNNEIGIHEKEELVIAYPHDEGVENLKFTWYKDDVEIIGIPNSPTLNISEISESEAGSYHVEVSLLNTETVFGTNIVRSGIWNVSVQPCQNISNITYRLVAGCSEHSISVSEINLSANEEIEYIYIVSSSSAEEYEIAFNEIHNLEEGLYSLKVVDMYGCTMESEEIDLSLNNAALQELNYNNCELEELPRFEEYPLLEKADISNNYLSWDDIVNIPVDLSTIDFTIFPQNNLTNDTLLNIHERDSLILVCPFDTEIDDLKYTWYKNGVELEETQNSATLKIPVISVSDAGNYHVEVRLGNTETAFGAGFVRSGVWNVEVNSCQKISDFTYDLFSGCKKQTISFSDIKLSGNEEMKSFSLINEDNSVEVGMELGKSIEVDKGFYKLHIIDMYGCSIESEEIDISINNTLLKGLDYKDCDLIELPDFNNYPLLEQVDISNNNLSWEDILHIINANNDVEFIIFPQQNLTEEIIINVHENDISSLSYPFDSGVEGLIFTWFKNGVELTETPNTSILELTDISPEDEGKYYVEVGLLEKNTIFGNNVVRSGIWTVEVTPCQTLLDFHYDLVEECTGQHITLTGVIGSNNELVENIKMKGITVSDEYELSIDETIQVQQGSYKFLFTDEYSCTMESDELVVSDGGNCELIIYPYKDGLTNNIWIEGEGSVSIFNKRGEQVNSLQLPVSWNGSDSHNEILPLGVYLLRFEDGSVKQVTIVH